MSPLKLGTSLPQPKAQVRPVEDVLHGVSITDPYRWLENGDDHEVAAWTSSQDAYTRGQLDAQPHHALITQRVAKLRSLGDVSSIGREGTRYFQWRRTVNQQQAVLFVRDGLEGTPRILLDPNTLDASGLTTVDLAVTNRTGDVLAYGLSKGGTEQTTLHVLRVNDGTVLNEAIPDTKHGGVSWLNDGSGFYYTRHPALGSVPDGDENYYLTAYFHLLGTRWEDDEVIFPAPDDKTAWVSIGLSDDDRFLIVDIYYGGVRNDTFVQDRLLANAPLKPVAVGLDGLSFLSLDRGRALLHTTVDAPTGTVLELPFDTLDLTKARTLIAPREETVLASFSLAGGYLLTHETEDAYSHVRLYRHDGAFECDLTPAPFITVSSLDSQWDSNELLLTYEGFLDPPTHMHLDLVSRVWRTLDVQPTPSDFNREAYSTHRLVATSKDGTKIPVFVVGPKQLPTNSNTPTLLTGYGGFSVALSPYYTPTLPVWLEMGGAFAVAMLRGGSEFGEDWHHAGMLGRKQNVFDDAIAAAELLISTGITSSEHLGFEGHSNGGLLAGALLTQRPDLFNAICVGVPLLDMIRYHLLQMAQSWVPEYGSSEDPEAFKWLYAYSPYHHVDTNTQYPAVLLTTALGDTRVDPMHARKLAARLQATSTTKPVLLRVDTDAGHGTGSSESIYQALKTDIWTFFASTLFEQIN